MGGHLRDLLRSWTFPVQENTQIAFLWVLCHLLAKVLRGPLHLAEVQCGASLESSIAFPIETDFVLRDA